MAGKIEDYALLLLILRCHIYGALYRVRCFRGGYHPFGLGELERATKMSGATEVGVITGKGNSGKATCLQTDRQAGIIGETVRSRVWPVSYRVCHCFCEAVAHGV